MSYDGSRAKDSSEKEASNLVKKKPSGSVDRRAVEIATTSFKDQAHLAIESFIQQARKSTWLDSLFNILREQFEDWKDKKSKKSSLRLLSSEEPNSNHKPLRILSHEALRRNLRSRKAKVLDLQRLSEKTLVPVRAAKGFQVKLSSDSTANGRLMTKLSKHEISRSVVAVDSRGRMILAEPCSLLFLSPIPAMNTRYSNKPTDAPLSRHHMCVIATSTLKFNIVGLSMCPQNERHVVVWGTAEACVAILKPHWDGIEQRIDLVFDLDQSEGEADYLVKCEWIPGSQTHVSVGCGRFVRIYDIARSDGEKRAMPVVGYNLGFEATLRDMSIVPYKAFTEEEGIDGGLSSGFPKEKISKLFLLLENGRLHVVDLKTGSNGKLESPGDQHFEPSECVILATSGVRPRAGSPLGQPGSTSRSLGEGSRLAYLKQSHMLLYKCSTSCVLALMLGAKGEVEGSFELLPHTVSSETLGNGADGCSVIGPFTHWTELGVSYRNGASFFRVACVGKSTKTNQPKLLCLEFNENEVRVKEIAWASSGSMGLGLSLSLSFEGLAAFSAPHVVDATCDPPVFGERAFLCVVTSGGSILFFGEEHVDALPSLDSPPPGPGRESADLLRSLNAIVGPCGAQKKPLFPLTLFERLKNISESDDLIFGGDGISRSVTSQGYTNYISRID